MQPTTGRPASVTQDDVKRAVGEINDKGKGLTLYAIRKITGGTDTVIRRHLDALGMVLPADKAPSDEAIADPKLRRAVKLLTPLIDQLYDEAGETLRTERERAAEQRSAANDTIADLRAQLAQAEHTQAKLDTTTQTLTQVRDELQQARQDIQLLKQHKEDAAVRAAEQVQHEKQARVQHAEAIQMLKQQSAEALATLTTTFQAQVNEAHHSRDLADTQLRTCQAALAQAEQQVTTLTKPTPPPRWKRGRHAQ